MSDDCTKKPPIYAEHRGSDGMNEIWHICLSRGAKIFTFVLTLVVSGVAGYVVKFAWESNRTMGEILQANAAIRTEIGALRTEFQKGAADNQKRIERLEGKHGL